MNHIQRTSAVITALAIAATLLNTTNGVSWATYTPKNDVMKCVSVDLPNAGEEIHNAASCGDRRKASDHYVSTRYLCDGDRHVSTTAQTAKTKTCNKLVCNPDHDDAYAIQHFAITPRTTYKQQLLDTEGVCEPKEYADDGGEIDNESVQIQPAAPPPSIDQKLVQPGTTIQLSSAASNFDLSLPLIEGPISWRLTPVSYRWNFGDGTTETTTEPTTHHRYTTTRPRIDISVTIEYQGQYSDDEQYKTIDGTIRVISPPTTYTYLPTISAYTKTNPKS